MVSDHLISDAFKVITWMVRNAFKSMLNLHIVHAYGYMPVSFNFFMGNCKHMPHILFSHQFPDQNRNYVPFHLR